MKKKDFIKSCLFQKKSIERSWLSIKESTKERIENNEIKAFTEENEIVLYRKFRAQERIFSVWDDKKYNSNHHGSRLIQELFGENLFDFPKSIHAIEDIMKLTVKKESLIIDIFSGSSTTAHAIMNLNSSDNGKRKYIMIQLPFPSEGEYKNICEIGKERIRRAGDRILEELDNKELDIGFKVFKLDSSNLTKWNPDYDNLENPLISAEDNIIEGRSELDLIYEILLKYGIDLTLPIEEYTIENYKIYSIGLELY